MSGTTQRPADSRPVVAKHGRVTDLEAPPREAARRGGGEGPAGPTQRLTGPTYLTILRMVLSVAYMVIALFPDFWAKIVALILFVIAAITDKIDGIWARSSKQVTDLGAFLDPLADKMLVNLAFLVLTYQNIVPIWVFAIILVRDFAIDGMRMMLATHSITTPASFLGKLKTTVQMTALIIILANQMLNNSTIGILGDTVLYLALALTIVSGINYLITWPKSLSGHHTKS